MRVMVTGASGFVGRHLTHRLVADGHTVTCVVRRGGCSSRGIRLASESLLWVDDIAEEPDWARKLQDIDAIVHLAARVHVMRETVADPLACFRRVNVLGSRRLADAAVSAGVKRFIFLSSIKVNGERTNSQRFRADDPPAPTDPYAISKCEAEQQLLGLANVGSTEFVVIRPPLVYGPGVKGNFERLVTWVHRGVPLPLGGLRQPRSMVSVGNLADFIALCLVHPQAANEVFLVSDGADWSTAELVTFIAAASDRSPRLFSVPTSTLKQAAKLIGKEAVADRLCDALQVDIRKNQELLRWLPKEPPERALQDTVQAVIEGMRAD